MNTRYLIIDSFGMRHWVDEIPAWVTSADVVLSNHCRTYSQESRGDG